MICLLQSNMLLVNLRPWCPYGCTHHQSKNHCRSSATPYGDYIPNGSVPQDTQQELLWNVPRYKAQRIDLASNFPRSPSEQAHMGNAGPTTNALDARHHGTPPESCNCASMCQGQVLFMGRLPFVVRLHYVSTVA